LVRVAWKDIETADNTYNRALIDNQIDAAQTFGKKISLAIGGGPNTPSWLYAQGAQSISSRCHSAARSRFPGTAFF